MNPMSRKRERGVALLAMLAVIALLASYFLVSRLNMESGGVAAANRIRSAAVLNQAKQALIGYVAQRAVQATENNPGRLPCPEAPGNFGDPANEGTAAGNCSLPSVGRLPWRTLGLDKLVDAAGEPLWYVVSTGWALSNSTTPPLTTNINSNSAGQITVNGTANDSVALIIAPGLAFTVAAAAGCAAWNQVRPKPTVEIPIIPDWRNYLECENATSPADASFVTTGPSGSFNDQVIRVTAADVLPAIEAAIANRIEREIVPVLKTVYGNADPLTPSNWGVPPSSFAFPFPATFGDPTTSGYLGQAGLYQGLLPFNYHSSSCPVGDSRCSTNAITWGTPSLSSSGGPGYLSGAPSCYVIGSTSYCEGYYYGGALNISMADPANDITRGLRTVNVTNHTGSFQSWRRTGSSWVWLGVQSATLSRSLASSGAANFNAGAALPSVPTWGYYYIYANRLADSDFGDHALLNPIDPPNQTPPGLCPSTGCTGWFVRNEWYRLLYYATAPNHAPGGTLSCTTGATCLSVANVMPAGAQRAILFLSGRSVNGTTRPSATLADYLESGNATGAFTRMTISASASIPPAQRFNDRIVIIGSN